MNSSIAMPPLHILLRDFIDKSNYTVYQLAKISNVNRSTLQKAISGERSISRENLSKIMPFLNLTLQEQQELQNALLISEMGEVSYQKHMYIKNLLTDSISLPDVPINHTEIPLFSSNKKPEYGELIKGSYQIIHAICDMLSYELACHEHAFLYGISSFHDTFFSDLYEQLQADVFSQTEIKHIVPFVKVTDRNDRSSLYNLNCLSILIPFIMSSQKKNCEFYYCYEESIAENLSAVPFLHSIVLPQNVILLSTDCQMALVLSKDTVPYFKKHFHTVLQSSFPLFNTVDTASLLSAFISLASETTHSYMLELQPCLTAFVDEEIIQNVINKDLPLQQQQLLAATLLTQCSILKKMTDFISIFSQKGLDDFVEKGIVYQVPLDLYHPLDLQARIKILEQLIEANESGSKKFYMIKEEVFHPAFEVFTYNTSMLFSYTGPDHKEAGICIIKEITVIDSFQDFLLHVVNHNLTYSLEETTDLFRKCYKILKKKLRS